MATLDDEDDLPTEAIERRTDVRGGFPGLKIVLLGPQPRTFGAVEASRRAFFVTCDNPDALPLSEVYDAEISLAEQTAHCRLEVVRKEIAPRHGLALRVAFIDPGNEERLRQMLGEVAE